MITPIKLPNPASPADLSTAELPASLARASTSVPPSEHLYKSGTSTSGPPHDEPNGFETSAIDKTLDQINNSMQAWATGIRFDVDEDAQRVVVSIIDSTSGEVLRTVPSEAVIRIAKMIIQLQGGIIDTQA